ncbi:DNA adenine methylase [Methanobrevibacter curvatus]|uniref:site-specific DNA-methyltransferase (adenine-specific) n=1 Tax=Methanobrevibacter curvatus TaxID=49547 RepID=A0A166B317_9EURY|nr:DNA adenine methylase [Methanobrevibacter curvatus]KZX12804.1 modification methylase DpnIIA [Methanobrevibacter curvatus]
MQVDLYGKEAKDAKPFLKWAGGKRQLIEKIENILPSNIRKSKKIDQYFEPFLGGGAIFFHLSTNYKIKESFIYDINKELILVYNTIKNDSDELINELSYIEENFSKLNDEKRKEFYLNTRKSFNHDLIDFDFNTFSKKHIKRASQTIFLNKTGFNGLFRLNKKGEFNVPMGRYKNPKICDFKNISNVSKILKNVKIFNKSFLDSERFISEKSLVYLDPPYRPLNKTSSFTSYSQNEFNDKEQRELADYFKRISKKGAYAILSNSDPKNEDPNDEFFDDIYKEFNITRVKAKRFINRNPKKRGDINEIIVTNYPKKGVNNG